MISAVLSRRVLRLSAAVSGVGLLLAIAMQAARVLAPLAAAQASSLEVAAAIAAVAVLASPFVVVLAAGLGSALAVTGLASDGARDALRAHGIGPARAALAVLPAALTIALVAFVAAAVLEPIAVRLVMTRASGLAERAVRHALDDGQLLPFGDEGVLALGTGASSSPMITIVTGPDARADVTMLRAALVDLRFPDEARLGPGVVAIRGKHRSFRLSFARARWPLGAGALVGAPNAASRSVIPDVRLAQPTLELVERSTRDADSLAIVARRALPALLSLLACLVPVLVGWSWKRPGAGLVITCGVVPSVVSLGVARALSDVRPAPIAELVAIAAFVAALLPALLVASAKRAARRARAA